MNDGTLTGGMQFLQTRHPFGRKVQLRRRYDWDAQAYFNRVQAAGQELSIDERTRISTFVRGLKGLGLWESLRDGWLLRAAQNLGAGLTVLAFKGSADGTRVNGPAWGPEGILFQAATQRITTSLGLPDYPATVLMVVRTGGWSGTAVSTFTLGGAAGTRRLTIYDGFGHVRRLFVNQNLGGGWIVAGNQTEADGTGFHLRGATLTGPTSGRVWLDGTTYAGSNNAQNWSTAAPGSLSVGHLENVFSAAQSVTQALALVFVADVTANAGALHRLIRDTVGDGLGLP